MPELPEVEVVRRGLTPRLVGRRIESVVVHEPRLRWPVHVAELLAGTKGATVTALRRRAKYLLLQLRQDRALCSGLLVVHLGMTGWLGVRATATMRRHDHVVFGLDDGQRLVFNDARRFGSVHWLPPENEHAHRLFAHLGPEPLDAQAFDGAYLHAACRGRKTTIKERLMDARVVVGVGNIYAAEALFRAKISPKLPAGKLSKPRAHALVHSVQETLHDAIAHGGTTLRDFLNAEGLRGLFAPRLLVYGRTGAPCTRCGHGIRRVLQGGRSTFYCPACQAR